MRKVLAALVFGLASLAAQADLVPLQNGNIIPGIDTGVYGEQTCPPPVGCVESGSTILTFNIINTPGSMALAIIGVLDPSSTGAYTFDVEVYDPFNNLIASGFDGTPSLLIPSFGVVIGNGYSIHVDWQFAGDGTTQTASWGVVAATSVNQVSEPSTVLLLGLGLMALGVMRVRRQA